MRKRRSSSRSRKRKRRSRKRRSRKIIRFYMKRKRHNPAWREQIYFNPFTGSEEKNKYFQKYNLNTTCIGHPIFYIKNIKL